MGKPQNKKAAKTEDAPAAPAKSGSSCSTVFLCLLVLGLGAGCGAGFQFLNEQLEGANLVVLNKVSALQEELAAVKESYASLSFADEIAAVGQMKEALTETRLQVRFVWQCN